MRVLYVYAGLHWWRGYEKRLVDSINEAGTGIAIEFWDWTREYGVPGNPSLKWASEHRELLRPFYRALNERAKNADVVMISPGGGVVPDIMAEIAATVVYCTTDDPDSSHTCSFPFLEAADVIAHAGVNFDGERRISDVFLERGAKRTVFFPIGFYEERFPAIEDFDEQFARRDIDLVYVGHLKRGKLETVMNRYRGMTVHSRSLKLKHNVYVFAKTRRWIRPFRGDLCALYARSKVGINMHFTFGPCNGRSYQLNAAGVAQVIDCPEGISEIYEPNSEVMVYANMEEAVEMIDALLSDDSARYQISRSGYERARREYNSKHLLIQMLREVYCVNK
ncbi:hypothetical protein LCGC14_0838670 [marine sediment metagenome]|uniref:Spore protein YkvP/CgeB glycosyl transferase-like domain-containing protein n=1 Tax=marine sediment metagenome TaxID=412755 RepID=A0A0F9SL39_9ZZZZ